MPIVLINDANGFPLVLRRRSYPSDGIDPETPPEPVVALTASDVIYSVSGGSLQSVPEGTTITVEPIQYTITADGVSDFYAPLEGELVREWFRNAVLIPGETSLAYTVQPGDTNILFRQTLTKPGFVAIVSQTQTISVQPVTPPDVVPPTPAPEDWEPYAGYYDPPTQSDESRPYVWMSGSLTVYAAQWTTGTREDQWETLAPAEPDRPAAPETVDVWVDAVAGNDANNGLSEGAAKATIEAGFYAASPGDTILVKPGTYNERLWVDVSNTGTVGNPITFYGMPGAIIAPSVSNASTPVVGGDADYINFIGFEIVGNGENGIGLWEASHWRVEYNTVRDCFKFGIVASSATRGAISDIAVINNTVYNCVLENVARDVPSGWARGIAIDKAVNCTVSGNLVYECYGEGIAGLETVGASYTDNTAYDCFSVQIYFDNCQDITCTGNKAFSTGNTGFYKTGSPAEPIMVGVEYVGSELAPTDFTITGNILIPATAPFIGNFDKATEGAPWNVFTTSTITPNTLQAIGTHDSTWLGGGYWFETAMRNPVPEGSRDWSLFYQVEPVRREKFCVRYQAVEGGLWSERSATEAVPVPAPPGTPDAPTLVSASAETADGEITLAATDPADWGAGAAAGTTQWSTSEGGPWTDLATSPETVTLGPAFFGQTIPIYFSALNSVNLRSAVVATAPVAVPGTASDWPFPGKAARWIHVSNQTLLDNADGWDAGEGRLDNGQPHQFDHFMFRSEADDDVAIALMDVGTPWICENAKSARPRWRAGAARGLECRDSASGAADPDTRDRFIVAYSEGGNASLSGHGLFVTENLGDDYVKVLECYINSKDEYRTHQNLIHYKPGNKNHWIFINPRVGIWTSTNRWASWTRTAASTAAVSAMGRVWDAFVSRGNDNTVWMATENGLYKTTNFGESIAKMAPSGLPAGRPTSFAYHPTNASKWYVVIYEKGLFVTTNDGISFSKVAINDDAIGQVAVCKADPNHAWVTGIWLGETGIKHNSLSQYTSNLQGVTPTWLNFTHDQTPLGWPTEFDDRPWLSTFKINGRNERMSMQCRICPSEDVPGEAVGSAQTARWRISGRAAVADCPGFDTLACGEADWQNIAWHPNNPDWVACALFDRNLYVSKNGGQSWKPGNNASSGLSGANCHQSADVNAETGDIIYSSGNYQGAKRVIISRNFGDGNAFRPSFFGTANQKEDWCKWHAQNSEFAMCRSGWSDDYGVNWQRWSEGNGYIGAQGTYAGVFAASPSNNDVLWAINQTGTQIGRSTNFGGGWTTVVSDCGAETRESHPLAFAPHPTDPGAIFWYERLLGLRRWKAGVGTTNYTNLGFPPRVRIQRIRIDPNDPDVMWLLARNDSAIMRAESGVNATDVYRSTNGPAGPFINVTANVPCAVSNRSIELDPHTGKVIVTGTMGARFYAPPYAVDAADAALALRNGV